MLSNYLTYETGLTRIDDLRRQADERRYVSLARSEPTQSHRRQRHPRPWLSLALRPRRAARA